MCPCPCCNPKSTKHSLCVCVWVFFQFWCHAFMIGTPSGTRCACCLADRCLPSGCVISFVGLGIRESCSVAQAHVWRHAALVSSHYFSNAEPEEGHDPPWVQVWSTHTHIYCPVALRPCRHDADIEDFSGDMSLLGIAALARISIGRLAQCGHELMPKTTGPRFPVRSPRYFASASFLDWSCEPLRVATHSRSRLSHG